jgi:hypothetical protein
MAFSQVVSVNATRGKHAGANKVHTHRTNTQRTGIEQLTTPQHLGLHRLDALQTRHHGKHIH